MVSVDGEDAATSRTKAAIRAPPSDEPQRLAFVDTISTLSYPHVLTANL